MAAAASSGASVTVAGSSSGSAGLDPPIEPRPLKALATLLAKRSYDLFTANHGQKVAIDEAGCATSSCWGQRT